MSETGFRSKERIRRWLLHKHLLRRHKIRNLDSAPLAYDKIIVKVALYLGYVHNPIVTMAKQNSQFVKLLNTLKSQSIT